MSRAESPVERTRTTAQARAGRALGWFALAGVVTALVLQKSLRDGRLSTLPEWDDVLYLTYAARRIGELHARGVWACVTGFATHVPHSPYSCLLAFGAFLVFGIHDWAPYLASGLAVFAFLCLCDWLFSRTCAATRQARWARLLTIIYVACIPAVSLGVAQYKPDTVWGMATAVAAALTLLRPVVGAPRRTLVITSVAWAAALMAKPTTSPGTAILAVICFGIAVVEDWVAERRRPPVVAVLRAAAWLAGPAAVVLVPFYAVAAPYFTAYIRRAMFSDYSSTWEIVGGWVVQARYYVTGPGGRATLAGNVYILAAVWVVGLLVAAVRRDRRVLVQGVALVAFTGACYLLPTVNVLKNPLLACPFHFCVIFFAVYWLAYLAGALPRGVVMAGLVGMVIAGPLLYRWPELARNYPPHSPEREQNDRLHREVMAVLRQHVRPWPQLVSVTATGPVREITLDYLSTIEGLPFEFGRTSSDKLKDFQLHFDEADFVLAQEQDVPGVLRRIPSARVQGAVLNAIRHRPDYAQVAEFHAYDGKRLFLFERTDHSRAGVFGDGVHPVSGVSPLIEPTRGVNAEHVVTTRSKVELVLAPGWTGPGMLRLTGVVGRDVTGVSLTDAGGRVIATRALRKEATGPEIIDLPTEVMGESLMQLRLETVGWSPVTRHRNLSLIRVDLIQRRATSTEPVGR